MQNMDLRNNKGYTGIDISITILILIILIPVITGMAYNIGKSNSGIEQKSYAITEASSALEVAKSVTNIENIYSKKSDTPKVVVEDDDYIKKLKSNFQDKLVDSMQEPQIKEEEGNEKIVFVTKDKNDKQYKILIDVEDFANTGTIEGAKKNIVKKITAKVIYRIGNKTENIEISNVISKK